jgi:phosphoglucomutase
MERMLIGGEESSGLTTRGHVPDKDGSWANLLVMDMMAYYQKSLAEIWEMVTSSEDGYVSYGGRVDVDASDRAKEKLISYFLDVYKGKRSGEVSIEGYPILYAGGTRYDMVEIFLADQQGRRRNYLRIRASGTEPIIRIYTETSDPELWQELIGFALDQLDTFTIQEIQQAYRLERLADLLATTSPGNWDRVLAAAQEKMHQTGWQPTALAEALNQKLPHLENRNKDIARQWLEKLQ